MNAYTFNPFSYDYKEDDEVVKTYVRNSSIVIFIHHIIVLSVIISLALHDPSFLPHWTSSEFRLNPNDYHCFYIFGITMLMGCYSLTVILYRAKHLAKTSVQSEDDQEMTPQRAYCETETQHLEKISVQPKEDEKTEVDYENEEHEPLR